MDYMKKVVYHSNYWYNDGLKKAQIRDMSGAILSLKRSLQFNRENIAARNLLGLVYYGVGEVPEALVQWIISKNLRSRDNIADYYIKNVQSSAKELETINLAIRKYNQCLGYCRQNGEDLAAIQLKQVISAHPSFLKAYQLLGLIYLHTEQYSRARQVLRSARRLDTTNDTTMRLLHELTQKRGKSRRKSQRQNQRQKSDAVEYSLGNETIIQPKHSRLKEVAGHLAVANLFVGAAIGAALIWFLVAPAVNQSRSDQMNAQMRAYSDQIKSLEAQVSAQTRTLDNYRASGEQVEADAQQAQTAQDSYERLMQASDRYDGGTTEYAAIADLLLGVTRDSLGESGQALYDELTGNVYPAACDSNFAVGSQALEAANYQSAVDALSKVVRMNSGYNDGQALLYLAQAYRGNGDNDNAKTYFQQVVDNYAGSDYAQAAQTALDEIAQAEAEAASAEGENTEG